MKILLYFFIILLILYILGLLTLRTVEKVTKTSTIHFTLIAPLVGAAFLMCVSQLLSIVCSATVIAVIVWLVLIASLIFLRKELLGELAELLRQHKGLMIISVIAFIILAFPMIQSNDLMSFQYQNNDIMFYLPTMDWLTDHSLLEAVQYSDARPYYVCAEYIFSTTRFGADVLGSVMMQMLGLQSHEIFSFMGIIYAVLSGQALYYLVSEILKVSSKWSTLITFVALINFSWKELLILQYIPQLLGIGCLIMFICLLMEFFHTDSKAARILTSLFLVATATTYAEFSSYMFIIYVGVVIIQGIYVKKWGKTIKDALLIGVFAVVFNPLGFAIAIRFNLDIFLRVSESASSIDAYGGNIRIFKAVISKLLGGPEIGLLNNYPTYKTFYGIFLIIVAICFVALFVYMLIRKRSKMLLFLTWVMFFFCGYELYFHEVSLAYGEYKHLVSIAALMVTVFLYFIYELEYKFRWKILLSVFAAGIIILNVISLKSTYTSDSVIKYDDALAEVSNGIDLVPFGERLGILGNQHFIQHQLVYAARDTDIQLMGEGVNSYFAMLGIPLNNTPPEYVLCMKDSEELDTLMAGQYEELWHNERFMIVRRLQSAIE